MVAEVHHSIMRVVSDHPQLPHVCVVVSNDPTNRDIQITEIPKASLSGDEGGRERERES